MIANPSYVWDRRRNEGDHTAHAAHGSIPLWLQSALGIPLELKVLGANLLTMAAAVLLLFGPLKLEPTRLTDALVVVGALCVAATVNFVLVRVALRPIRILTRVAWLVSEGLRGERVPRSIFADSDLTQLSTTINQLLDDLVTERMEINELVADLAKAGVTNGRLHRVHRRLPGIAR